jgi:hypothetical protein
MGMRININMYVLKEFGTKGWKGDGVHTAILDRI